MSVPKPSINLVYRAPGPIAGAFVADREHSVCAAMGPIGSGKTSAALMRILLQAIEQRPSSRDGVRYTKWAVIRDTYRQIHRTVLPSWHKRVPREFGKFNDGGSNAPSTHHLRFHAPGLASGNGIVDSEVIFAAIGDNDVEAFARGFEVTGFYLNELDLLAPEVLQFLPGRTGRYPDMSHGGPTWRGVIADFNAPDTESWIYRDFFEAPLAGYKCHVQPSGLSPQAENLENLPERYYDAEVIGKEEWYVRRMIRNEFGFSRAGKPVYPEFSDRRHVAAGELAPIRGLPLILGFDQGLHAAMLVMQRSTLGQWLWLDELEAPEAGIAASLFGERCADLLASRYRGFRYKAYGDPAGWARDNEEQTWMDIVGRVLDVDIKPAPSNVPSMRQEPVRIALMRDVGPDKPGLVVSPRCIQARRGFNSAYRYRKRPSGVFEDQPEKNRAANVHDAAQYGMLGESGVSAVMNQARLIARERRPQRVARDVNFPLT